MKKFMLLLAPALLIGVLAAPASALGAGWSITPSPNPRVPTGRLFWVSCPAAGSCMAVGTYVKASGAGATLAERWNGRSWRVLRTPNPRGTAVNWLNGVSCTSESACTAVGISNPGSASATTLAERWNGRTWQLQKIPTRPGAFLNGVSCVSGTDCVAVGGSDAGTLAERWNGERWTVQPTPAPPGASAPAFNAVSCASAASCMAVGTSDTTGGRVFVIAERWNGRAWKLAPAPTPSRQPQNVFFGVACPAPAACIGVGTAFDASNNPTGTFAERWHGTRWTVQRTPTHHTPGGFLGSVWCQSATACIATGGTNAGTLAERLRGTTWRVLRTPNPPGTVGDFLSGVSCTSLSACTGVGLAFAAPAFFPPQTLAERWNGTRWRIQPTPTPPGTNDIPSFSVACPAPSACIAVGGYKNNGQFVTLAERWNGAGQSALLPASRSAPPGGLRSACLRAPSLRPLSARGRTPESGRRWPQAATLPTPASAGQPTRLGWCPRT